jgi:hypothetical protein
MAKSQPQRNEAVTTISLIIVAYFLGIFTYITASHSCAMPTSGEAGKICAYKAKADAHLGNFPEYTAWLEQNFHVGFHYFEHKLRG